MKKNLFPFVVLAVASPLHSEILDGEGETPPRAAPARYGDPIALDGFCAGIPGNASLQAAIISRDGSRIATASGRSDVALWDAATGKRLAAFLDARYQGIYALKLALDPRDRWLVTAGPWMLFHRGGSMFRRDASWAGGIVQAWRVDDRDETFRFVSENLISDIYFNKESDRLICIKKNCEISFIDTRFERHVLLEPDSSLDPGGDLEVGLGLGRDAGVSDDGLRAGLIPRRRKPGARAEVGEPGILLYDAAAERTRLVSPREVADAVGVPAGDDPDDWGARGLAVSPDGKLVALRLLKRPDIIYLVGFDDLKLARSVALDDADEIDRIEFDPDSRRLALGTRRGRINVFDVQTGRRIASHGGLKNLQEIQSLRFVGDELLVLSGGESPTPPVDPEDPGYDAARLYRWSLTCPLAAD